VILGIDRFFIYLLPNNTNLVLSVFSNSPKRNFPMTHTVHVTGYNSDGEGVARFGDGRVVFIRGAARYDVLEVVLTQEFSKIARAEIVCIIKPSPYRIESDCVAYPECGGCDYRHITYEEELDAKLQCVNDALKRIGGLSVQVSQILHTGQINGYRNKAVLHCAGSQLGFYNKKSVLLRQVKPSGQRFNAAKRRAKAGSHDIVPIEHCLLLEDDLNVALKSLIKNGIDGIETDGDIPLRCGRNGTAMPLEEELDGLIFRLEGFFQINRNAALLLFQKAREYAALSKNEIFVDLYCGVGALTLFVGRDAGFALGVEQNLGAVKVAKENAERNNLSHIEFVNADAAKWESDTSKPDCIIVDPPRKGLSQGAVSKILELSPKRLVYISCNPATLARDLKMLNGYVAADICAVDMFPRTANIECCCLLVRES